MKNVILLSMLMFLLAGFSSTDSDGIEKDAIIAVWVHSKYNSGGIEFVKRKRFKKGVPGIEFKKNGDLIKRQNIGWCGTAPVTYGDFNGTWKFTSDSMLTIHYEYWGGMAQEEWRILILNSNKFKIERRTPDE